ncbi:hypothetical protein BDN72DRAFT_846763 [Pluteus cervinus]|uniref:Uncharacterized protein n=1 Tax=Pluteus cervinus TaxID=181527 RepID=A0ACD3AFN0_9AGAR|nr:hypothetical protein BDN72DRAFT_846763 [Pluteus cervinus]
MSCIKANTNHDLFEFAHSNASSASLPSLLSDAGSDMDTDIDTDNESHLESDIAEHYLGMSRDTPTVIVQEDIPARPSSRLGFHPTSTLRKPSETDVETSSMVRNKKKSRASLQWAQGLFRKNRLSSSSSSISGSTSTAVDVDITSAEGQTPDESDLSSCEGVTQRGLEAGHDGIMADGTQGESDSEFGTDDDCSLCADDECDEDDLSTQDGHSDDEAGIMDIPLVSPTPIAIQFPSVLPGNANATTTSRSNLCRFSCLPSPLSEDPSSPDCPFPCLNPPRHNYQHHGYSRHALLHLRWFWSMRGNDWEEYSQNLDGQEDGFPLALTGTSATMSTPTTDSATSTSTTIPTLDATTTSTHSDPHSAANTSSSSTQSESQLDTSEDMHNEDPIPRCAATQSLPDVITSAQPPSPPLPRLPPLSIHPRKGDIAALRDPYCMHIDRCFVALPIWTMAKTLWMYDIHTGMDGRRRWEEEVRELERMFMAAAARDEREEEGSEAGTLRQGAATDEGQEQEQEQLGGDVESEGESMESVTSSAGGSDDSDVTLVDATESDSPGVHSTASVLTGEGVQGKMNGQVHPHPLSSRCEMDLECYPVAGTSSSSTAASGSGSCSTLPIKSRSASSLGRGHRHASGHGHGHLRKEDPQLQQQVPYPQYQPAWPANWYRRWELLIDLTRMDAERQQLQVNTQTEQVEVSVHIHHDQEPTSTSSSFVDVDLTESEWQDEMDGSTASSAHHHHQDEQLHSQKQQQEQSSHVKSPQTRSRFFVGDDDEDEDEEGDGEEDDEMWSGVALDGGTVGSGKGVSGRVPLALAHSHKQVDDVEGWEPPLQQQMQLGSQRQQLQEVLGY